MSSVESQADRDQPKREIFSLSAWEHLQRITFSPLSPFSTFKLTILKYDTPNLLIELFEGEKRQYQNYVR